MNPTFKNILKILAIPLSLLVVYFSMLILWKIFNLPPLDKLEAIIKIYFDKYGLWIVFISALIEGFLLIGQYFPGGVVIFLGVTAARDNLIEVGWVLFVVGVAFFIAYYLNYIVGRYGWYKLFLKFGLGNSLDKAKAKLEKHVMTAILGSYWEPNLASITATAAGVLKIPLRYFLTSSLIGIVIWNLFWGIVVYFLGYALLQHQVLMYVTIIAVWCAIILFKVFVIDKKILDKKAEQK
jgi:membrane protein DedA with SNARE-associated domain